MYFMIQMFLHCIRGFHSLFPKFLESNLVENQNMENQDESIGWMGVDVASVSWMRYDWGFALTSQELVDHMLIG